ncbi:MAG: SulP family inorganic anion transporter [Solirubrobacteraceae bacterium]
MATSVRRGRHACIDVRCANLPALPSAPGPIARLVPAWAQGYERAWLRADVIAGIVVASVVVPQAVAYAQIAQLPPEAGLMAAPGAMIAYALLGTSRTLVVSATTATAAVSAAAIGPLAGGDTARFAALSAAFALVTAVVLLLAGALRLGAVADLVSKPVMTGFLFGLGLTIMVSQAPSLIGVPAGDGDFFPRLEDLIGDLGDVHTATLVLGLACVAVLAAGKRFAPVVPWTLVVLVAAIGVSALFDLDAHGVAVVGDLPTALPDPALPDVGVGDLVDLIAPALGVLVLTAEALGVSRSLATLHGYKVDANRDLAALGSSNLLAGLGSGFVQSGGASQTAAAEGAGGRTQLATLIAGVLVLLTGAFLTSLFEPLPEATLAAIVIVAVAGFLRADELARFARIRTSAVVFAGLALAGVLALGVLQGLVITAVLTLIWVIRRLAEPDLHPLARDPASGMWGRIDRHPDWIAPEGVHVLRNDGPLFYANAAGVKERILAQAADAEPVVLDLSASGDLDVGALDLIGELADALPGRLWLTGVRTPEVELLARAGLAGRVHVEPRIDAALERLSPS